MRHLLRHGRSQQDQQTGLSIHMKVSGDYLPLPVVPHKAVAEVSKIGKL